MPEKTLYRPSKVILKHLNYGNIAFFQRFGFKTRPNMHYHDTRQKIEYPSV